MQLPTSFISKQLFTASIEALRQQFVEDKKNAEVMALMFRAEDFGKYDNSLLSNAILELLRMSFPKDEDGHCEIEHYCYCANFGKIGDEFESAEELYERLCHENEAATSSDDKVWVRMGDTLLWYSEKEIDDLRDETTQGQ